MADVAIVGAGAVGLGLASCLVASGWRPALVLRDPARRRRLEAEGFERSGLFGPVRVPPEACAWLPTIAALSGRPLDAVLVCTKSTASEAVAEALAGVDLPGEPPVVLCQNGWGNAERFAARLPAQRVFNARVITGFQLRDPRHVEVTAHAQPIHMGSLFAADPELLAPLARAIAQGGIPCETTTHIERDLWAKLLYNCALNPLAALRGVPYGVLTETPESRAVLEAVVREIFAVLAAAGRATHWPDADAWLAALYGELLPPTREHESSMLQDLRAGRATEIDALCGAVASLGRECGVATPVNQALTVLVHGVERAAATLEPR